MTRLTRWLGMTVVGMALVGLGSASALAEGMLSGKIISVDPQHNLLKVKTGLLTQSDIVVHGSTKISDGAKDMVLGDLRPGDQITVSYEEKNGRRFANSLTIVGENQAAPAQPASEPAQPKSAPQGVVGQ